MHFSYQIEVEHKTAHMPHPLALRYCSLLCFAFPFAKMACVLLKLKRRMSSNSCSKSDVSSTSEGGSSCDGTVASIGRWPYEYDIWIS